MPPPPTPNPATASAQLLEKKATFGQGCQQLVGLLDSPSELESVDQVFKSIQRARTLLNCRYTNPEFWRAASSLFRSASRASVFSEAQRAQLHAWKQEASTFLDEGDEGEGSSSAGGGMSQQQQQQQQQRQQQRLDPDTLLQNLIDFQGGPRSALDDTGYVQLQLPPQQPPVQQERPEDRAGNFMLELLDMQQGHGEHQQHQQQQQQQQEQQQEQGDRGASRPQGAENRGDHTRQHLLDILQAVEAVQSGVGSLSRNTEAIRNELDAVIMALAARSSEESVRERRPVPPASKEAIAKLPLFTWDEAKQQQQEQSVCSVCTEVLQVGDQVQSLPCHETHLFHPACLRPWLSKSNACPVCREELPTDDLDYEAEKERRAEQEKERRGAQNAIDHNEFMYM